MRKDEQKRKRSRSGSRGIEARFDLNYEDGESELSSGDLSSSDLDLAYDYNVHAPKKKSRRKTKDDPQHEPLPLLSIPKGYVSDIDETGEEKVNRYGQLLGGREYKVPVFSVPTRGDTVFMFSKDPAALLGFRDSFVFVKRNSSLIKAHLNNEERGYLVDSGQLRSSFRTRDISVVTARSVYKRFGHRIVRKGRKGKDDYYFTEESDDFTEEQEEEISNQYSNSEETNNSLAIGNNPSTSAGLNTGATYSGLYATPNNHLQSSFLSSSNPGKNGLQFETSEQQVDDTNYIHCAAVTTRQFNNSIFLYRRSNSTNYDLLTNVYQIPKTKQVFNDSKPIIKKELDKNTPKNPFIY
ncbi:chromatin remodelling complex Rsc7/Swp82 subunit-domain-containing protein [Sporodiniella umbellata]|nr:chromatin remodelling complex Rsc7/Swp82 subunit-domain-containing protein [Sporodiniella umbellata]